MKAAAELAVAAVGNQGDVPWKSRKSPNGDIAMRSVVASSTKAFRRPLVWRSGRFIERWRLIA